MAKICAVSDVHCTDIQTEPADILTVSGDLTYRGSLDELAQFRKWLVAQPQKYKVVIAGNHDFCLEDPKRRAIAENMLGGDGIVYLRDQLTVVEGLRIYGSPWQPWFHDWAFNLERGTEIALKWAMIPENVDILLTHGPPFGYGDRTFWTKERVGCADLLAAIDLKKPRVTCFGHIHEDAGEWTRNGCKLINCNVGYKVGEYPTPKPVVFELEPCTTGFTE